jgi:cold shock CspA family protein
MASAKVDEAPLLSGKVVRFEENRGYGFVAPDGGGEDVFLHANDLPLGLNQIACGLRVKFRVVDGGRGPKAYDVRLSDGTVAPSASVAPVAAVPVIAASSVGSGADDTCDVLTEKEFVGEITEVLLLAADAALTAAQIVAIRKAMSTLARAHGWVE